MSLKGRNPQAALAALSLALACPWAAAQQAATAAAPADGPAAKRATIDPATGRLSNAESDAAAPAAAAAARSAAPAAASQRGAGLARLKTSEVFTANGMRGMRVGAEHLNFTRVTRAADGSLSATCTVGESAEDHARHAAAITGAAQPVSLVRRSAAQKGASDVE